MNLALDVIHFASLVAATSSKEDCREMLDMIEAICRHRDLPVDTCVRDRRLAILQRFPEWPALAEKVGITPKA